MKSFIAFVLLFSLRTISLAADVTVYEGFVNFNAEPGAELKPIAVSQFPWKFTWNSRVLFAMIIFLKNKPPSVTAINVTYVTEYGTFVADNYTERSGPRIDEEYYSPAFRTNWKPTEMNVNLYSSNILCASLLVAEGRVVTTIPNEKKAQYYDISSGHSYAPVVVVDLINQCEDPPLATGTTMNTTTENTVTTAENINPNNTVTSNNNSSTDLEITTNENTAIDTKNAEQPQNLLLYIMIPSVIGTSAVVLVTYLLWKKKYCHWNSRRTGGIELNTVPHEPFHLNMQQQDG